MSTEPIRNADEALEAAEIKRLTQQTIILTAEKNDTLAALIRAEKELAQLTAYKKEAEKYIASITAALVKQRDRAEEAEELLRAYEVVVSRRVE